MACNPCSAGGWRKKSGQHPECGGLPGAVGSKKTDDLALGDFEGNLIDGQVASIAFTEISNLDHVNFKVESGVERLTRRGVGFN